MLDKHLYILETGVFATLINNYDQRKYHSYQHDGRENKC